MQTLDYRAGLEVLGRQECLQVLASHPVGSLTVVVDGSPTIIPVNHHVVDSDTIVLRSAGTKLSHARSGARMSLEVDGIDDTGQDWSVAVHGVGRELVPAERARLRELGLEPPSVGSKSNWIRILPQTITGRRIAARA
jgi:nitroimidazol reductase NimA-like FMN-containing flavoprotein (pyridoxamine 5'-phosphate oxidase superfamily)